MKVRYSYRLRPGARAKASLHDEYERCRFLYNESLRRIRDDQPPIDDKELTVIRSTDRFVADGSVVPQQQVLRGFRRADAVRRRRFKNAESRPSLNYSRRGFSFDGDGRLKLAKGITVPVVWSRPLPSPPTSVRVFQDREGYWFASFVVEREPENLPSTDRSIGIDWGLSKTATTTDRGFDFAGPVISDDLQARLRRELERAARRQPGSKLQAQAVQRVEKLKAKVARSRREQSRLWAQKVVQAHDFIAFEDLDIGFFKTERHARLSAIASIGVARRELVKATEKTEPSRTVVVAVPAPYTTTDCSACGARQPPLPVEQRVFSCPACGLIIDRDRNAARNVLQRGWGRAGP